MPFVAKFRCHSVTHFAGGQSILLHPVFAVNPESPNWEWSQATPEGRIEISITKPEQQNQFTPGKEYLITLTAVDQPNP